MTAARRDYSLNGAETRRAHARGLVAADWYRPPVARARMKALMRRSDRPALQHLLLWLALIAVSGGAALAAWGTAWAAPAFLLYCALLSGAADARWHECGHGTAFRTRWLNAAVYHFASFWLLRQPDVWRWSHARHHSDTIIVGRDPEIVTPRPPDLRGLLLALVNLRSGPAAVRNVFLHAVGRTTFPEEDFVPAGEWPKVRAAARAWIAVWAAVVAVALATGSLLPLCFVFLPPFLGHWLVLFFGATQHLGLDDNVLDHRLNTRTVLMNPVFRFLYLNMNYHIEHHLFPTVPYHALPALHAEIREHLPPPCSGVLAAYGEIIPALARQLRDPDHRIRRQLPDAPATGGGAATPAPARRS